MSSRGFTHESSQSTMPEGEENQWFTPKYIFDALGLEFDMDTCSPGEGLTHVPAKKHLTIVEDGLATPWEGTVFVNPPYGKHTPLWLDKLAEHGDGIALVFTRTDAKWFQKIADKITAVCFISGRVRFHKGNIDEGSNVGTPGTGSMLIAFGDTAADALKKSGLGSVFTYAK